MNEPLAQRLRPKTLAEVCGQQHLLAPGRVRRVSIPGKADRFDHTLCWHSHLYCNACGSVVDADVDEKQVMKLVRNQKGVVQDCAVVLFGLCETCAQKQTEASV